MVCPKIYPNLRQIASLLPGTMGPQVADYWGKRDMTKTHAAMPIIARISRFQVRGFHLDISLQSFPGPWVPALGSSIYSSRNGAPLRAPIFHWLFLHESDSVQSGQNCGVEQLSVCSKTYPNLGPIAPLLPRMVGTQSCSLLREARHHRTPSCNTTYR